MKPYFVILLCFFNSEILRAQSPIILGQQKPDRGLGRLVSAPISLIKIWPDGEYWKPETYSNHNPLGANFAVDFYYNARNRPELFRNFDSGIKGRSILSASSGIVFLHLLDVTQDGNGNFTRIDANRVIQGLDPIPKNSFVFNDGIIDRKIDLELVVDASISRTVYVHLQIVDSYFSNSVMQNIRTAIMKFLNNQAVGSPQSYQRVAINTGQNIIAGDEIGIIDKWGLANDYHLHFEVHSGQNYSESSPFLGNALDLSDRTQVLMDGQTILDNSLQADRQGVYQYPAMLRRSFNINDQVSVNTSWDGVAKINIRESAGGNLSGLSASNGDNGQIISDAIIAELSDGTWHVWRKINFKNIAGWVATEYLDDNKTNLKCSIVAGQDAPSSDIQSKFITAYNTDGSSILGCPTGSVLPFTNSKYSTQINGYHQDFQGGSASWGLATIDFVPGYSAAYSVKKGFYQTFMSADASIASYPGTGEPVYKLLVAPTEFESRSTNPSVVGTLYNWQPFIKGSMYYYVTCTIKSGMLNGQISYVWGDVYDRYEREGGRNSSLGLPLFSEFHYGTYNAWDWWFQWLERGFVWYAKLNDQRWTYAYQYSGNSVYENGTWQGLGWCQHLGNDSCNCQPAASMSLSKSDHSLLVADSPPAPPSLPGVPSSTLAIVNTGVTSSTAQTSVNLNGTVNPNGSTTIAWFEWGISSSYGNTTSGQNLGSGSSSIPVSANVSGLTASSQYHFRVVAQNGGGTSCGNDQTFTILAANVPTITFTPSSISFTASQGGMNPASQSLTISNSGSGTMNWSIASNQYWLTVNPQLGTNTQQVTISVDISSLSLGSYSAQLTINAPGASNSPQVISVSLVILPSGVFSITWQNKQSMSVERWNSVSAVFDNKLHVFGGDYALSYYRYDPVLNQWTTLPNLPGEGVREGGAAVIGNKVYLVDGTFGQLSLYDFLSSTWIIGTPVPTVRRGAVVLPYGGKLYVIGGTNGSLVATSLVEVYDPNTNSWQRKTSMPTPRGFAGGAVVNGLLYVIGGRNDTLQYSPKNTVEVYDPNADSWTTKNPMPTSRSNVATTVLNNKIYIIGGMGDQNAVYRTVEEYDPSANMWRTASPIQVARMSPVAGTILGNIFVAGGYDGTNILSSVEEGVPTLQTPVISVNPTSLSYSVIQGNGNPPSQTFIISNYGGGNLNWSLTKDQTWLSVNPLTGTNTGTVTVGVSADGMTVGNYIGHILILAPGSSNDSLRLQVSLNILPLGSADFMWISKHNMPNSRTNSAYATLNNKIHIIGGNYFLTHYSYDPSTDTWSSLQAPPFGISDGGAAAINGKIYVISDFSSSAIAIYDPISDQWSQGSSILTQRQDPAVATVNDKMYVFGGVNSPDSVEVYDPSSGSWNPLAPMPTGRYAASAVSLNDSIYVLGGRGNGGVLMNAVEVYNPLTNTWTARDRLNAPPFALANAVTLNNKIYVIGGWDRGDTNSTQVYEYNPYADTTQWSSYSSWRKLSPIQVPRNMASAGIVNNKIYVIGGKDQNSTPLSSVEEGTPAAFSISGQVFGQAGNIVVQLQNTPGSTGSIFVTTSTDASGNFSFLGLSYGNYYVIPIKSGFVFSPQYRTVTISGGNQTNQTFSVTPTPPNTWEKQLIGTTNNLQSVSFTDSHNGWIVGGSTILHTTDGGTTWMRQTPPSNDYYILRSVSFVDSLKGWAADYYQGIIGTSNSGNSWFQVFKSSNSSDCFQKVYALDQMNVWATTSNGVIARTMNSGLSWSTTSMGQSYLADIFFINPAIGWLAKDGNILKTLDGGSNWSIVYNPSSGNGSYIYNIRFSDSLNGWAVGSIPFYKILRTTDGGQTWILDSTGISSIFAGVVAPDSGIAYIVGNRYTQSDADIVRTTDCGISWSLQPSGAPVTLTGISFAENNLWAVGTSGTILHSEVDVPRAPTIVFVGLDSLKSNAATVRAIINPNSLATMCWLEYSTDSLVRSPSVTTKISINSGMNNQKIQFALVDLSVNAKYYFRIVSSNPKGTRRSTIYDLVTTLSGIDKSTQIPKCYALFQNYPNPFNPLTIIEYEVPKNGFVKIVVYDILGREVRVLVDEMREAGAYKAILDAGNLSSGIYLCRMTAGSYNSVKKLLLIR